MADRVVKVTLRAVVNDYNLGIESAHKRTAEFGSATEKLAQQKESFDSLGRASMAMAAVAGVAVGLAVSKFAEFDQAMSEVKADTQETAENMALLRDAAVDAGASTVFSATESANAIDELGKAGLSTADILGGALSGSLDLASAGGLGVARAAEITSIALQQYNLDGSAATHVSDVLAAGAGKAMGSVEDLANGLKFVGPIANSMGISLEETTGVMAMFAQQGIIGEQAGTSLRGVIASLTSPSAQARGEIERLGLTLYDADENFLGMENAAGQLAEAYGSMGGASRDASMGIIFGRETVTAATALYQSGAAGVAEWTDAVDDTGYAAKVAADKLDNLKGDVEGLGGAFDTALISSGSAANDALRFIVQTATDLLDLFNDAPEWVQATALALGVVAGAAGLAGGAFFLLNPRIQQFKLSLSTMGPLAQRTGAMVSSAFGPVGIILAGATVALSVFASAQADAKAKVEAFSDTLNAQTGAVTSSTRDLITSQFAAKESFAWMSGGSVYDWAGKLGIGLDTVTDAAMGNADALAELDPIINVSSKSMDEQRAAAEAAGLSWDDYRAYADSIATTLTDTDSAIGKAREALLEKQEADKTAAAATEKHEAALGLLEGKAEDTGDAVDKLAEQIKGFGSAELDTRAAAREFEAALDDLQKSVKDNGATLDISTEKGRANESALDALAQKSKLAAAAIQSQTGDQKAATEKLEEGRDALIKSLEQFGITGDAAEAYADKLGLIPSNIEQIVKLQGVEDAQRQLSDLTKDRTISLNVNARTGAAINAIRAAGLSTAGEDRTNVGQFYNGGATGPGGKYEPKGIVHANEFVFTQEATSAIGVPNLYAMMHAATRGGYVGGGHVTDAPVRYATPSITMVAPAGGGRPISITQQITAAPGMSAEQVGQIAAAKIETVLKGMN